MNVDQILNVLDLLIYVCICGFLYLSLMKMKIMDKKLDLFLQHYFTKAKMDDLVKKREELDNVSPGCGHGTDT